MVELPANVLFRRMELKDAHLYMGDEYVLDSAFESAIGHADTARIVSGMLGVELPANRVNVKLAKGEKMIVAQYSGPRLPEGATTLPDGAKIEFVLVDVS